MPTNRTVGKQIIPMLKLARIRQLFPHRELDSPRKTLLSLLKSNKFNKAISGRKRIAIAVGSRGISDLVMIVRELVGYLIDAGVKPFIVPAMGSHGFATEQGQRMVLNNLGISRDTIGAEIVSSMDVVTAGYAKMDSRRYPVYVDRAAWEQSDGIILINRIKPHTDFVAKYESGLVKMAVLGLGNHKGAEQIHSLGTAGLQKLTPLAAKVVFGGKKIIGGLAIIEDAYHKTAGVYWLNRERIFKEEPALLRRAKLLMPRLPIGNIDLLIIKQMGKEISGVGIDTKLVGRIMIRGQKEPLWPKVELIGICDITDKSYGNALGVGLADFITEGLFDKIDFRAMRENVLTATFYQRAKIPVVLDNERQIIETGLQHFQRRGKEKIKVIMIKDTLNLSDMYVSEAVLDELKGRSNIELVYQPKEITYDDNDKIIADL